MSTRLSDRQIKLISVLLILIIAIFWWLGTINSTTEMTGKTYRAGLYQIKLQLKPSKPKVGNNLIRISLLDNFGQVITDANISAIAIMPGMGSMPEMRAPAKMTHEGKGLYSGSFDLSMIGAWPLTIKINSVKNGSAELFFDLKTSREGLRLENSTPASGNPSQADTKNDGTKEAAESTPVSTPVSTLDANGFALTGKYLLKISLGPDSPRVGRNKIQIEVKSIAGKPIRDAKIRALVQFHADNKTASDKVMINLKATSDGIYVGHFKLAKAGNWPLAVDIETPELGHADLVFNMNTNNKSLKLTTATPTGISHYTCSMHPSVKSKKPGTCPICSMPLTVVTKKEVSTGIIHISAQRRQLIGVTTQKVQRLRFIKTIRAAGRITYNESKMTDVSLKFNGWIGKLHADHVGIKVQKGETLFTIYSPDLVAAQEEYLEAIRKRQNKNDPLVKASVRRLMRWNVSKTQIDTLSKTRKAFEYMPILSPVTGTVINKNIVEGAAIKAGKTLFRIVDLSTVWVEGQIYEYELADVKKGMKVDVVLPDIPGEPIPGIITYVSPVLEKDSRTNRVRVELDNKEGKLLPNMYAHVHIKVDRGEKLVVPESAVLYSGRNRIVFVDLGNGRLQPRKIKTGARNDNYIEVSGGLKENEVVVTSGNFLIGAESKLKSGINQW